MVIRPEPDHHTLYHLFFSHHTRQSLAIESNRSLSPQQATAADASLAAQYKITVAELAIVNKVIATASQKLDSIEAEGRGLIEAASHSNAKPLQSKIDDLNTRRYLTVVAGIAAIRRSLPAKSWTNLRAYINNQYRNTTQVLR